MKKISILMPTYNDADTISETLDSLMAQTYKNWELIIIDDGSKDNTKEIINNYKKSKDKNKQIKYLYQENQDQLLAIINGLNYANGDYICVLHSDDLLYDNETFIKVVNYLEENPEVDSIIGDLTIIDEHSNVTGVQKVNSYINKKRIPAIQLLWLGRNLYVDVAIHKKEIFKKYVYENYLIWNRPFWLSINEKVEMLNVKKVDFSFYKYRVYAGNYANNEIGKLCLLNGELRTFTELMNFYNIPLFRIQYIIFRIFSHLNLTKFYFPIYENKETKNKGILVDYVIKKRFPEGYDNNEFLKSLVSFYTQKNRHRTIVFEEIYNGTDPIYLGNNLRRFNRELLEGNLPKIYIDMFKEMKLGFDEIIVSKNNKEKALNLTKFLCIFPFVKVRCKRNEKN